MSATRVLLADGSPAVLDAVTRMLEPEFDVIGTVRDGSSLVGEAERLKPDVMIVELLMVATQAGEGQTVPFYLEPTLGGNDFLRGFERYRFYDQSSLLLTAEHRWHLFSGGHAAIFAEAGKVAPKATQLNLAKAKYAGGIGFRFTLRDAVIMGCSRRSRRTPRCCWRPPRVSIGESRSTSIRWRDVSDFCGLQVKP